MNRMRRTFKIALLLTLLSSLALTPLMLYAQNSQPYLTIAVPDYIANNLRPEYFAPFEADHPGIKVIIKKLGNESYYPSAAYEPEKFASGAAKFVNAGDILFVSNYNLSVEATRAGYFLDLAPLVANDKTLAIDDFVPAAWQSYQWDRGIWALPVSLDVLIMSYDPAAFDQAGLTYPSAQWTMDDLANAARKLTQRDSKGAVTVPGFSSFNPDSLYRSLAGEGFYDASVVPNSPQFDKPGLVKFLETWLKLDAEGVTGGTYKGDFFLVPLRVDQSYSITVPFGDNKPRGGSLLPGGKAGLIVNAFAVSAGTQQPDLAYALTKFMTADARISNAFFDLRAARKSLADKSMLPSDVPRFSAKFSPENQVVIDQAIANALPVAETRFSDYISKALGEMKDKKLDARSALQAQQSLANSTLKTVMEKRPSLGLAVATLAPTPNLKPGELTLNFNLTAYVSPLPNRELWDQVIKDFVSSDPQVRQVAFETGFGSNFNDLTTKFDCFALPNNVTSFLDTTKILDMSPLLGADPSFDKKDVIGNALSQLESNNKIWGMPLYIQPQVLRYDSEKFAKAGLTLSTTGWTTDQFADILKALKPGTDDPAPFVPRQMGSTYLMMLIAGYGGLPLDFRSNPPVIAFNTPESVDAIRQVLDLAKKGYLKYELATRHLKKRGL